MPWNGNGVFTRVRNWVSDKNNGIKIVAALHDQEDDNITSGIQACLTRNNETKPISDFRPNADDNLSLGSSTLRWLRIFVSSGIRIFSGASNFGDLSASTLTANRTYSFPDSSGTVVLKDASSIIKNVNGAAFENSGYEATLQVGTLTANRVLSFTNDSGNVVLDSSAQDLSNKSFAPEGASAGQAGSIRLKELAANGSNFVHLRAADAMAANYSVTLPANQGGAGSTLTNDGTGTLLWQTPNSVFGPVGTNAGDGGRIQLQELAANGTHAVRIKAPDTIAANFDLTMPTALPSVDGAGMSFSTAGLATFTASPMATRQTADESALIFSLIGI